MTSIFEIILSTWRLFEKMAPYLLLGFFVAGLLRALLPEQMVVRHLSKKGFSSILKASLIGVPLPLCSCGVLPVATHLRKQGANNGAAVSFLVSTPSTGVDSLFASYALLGPIFAVIRPVYSLTAGVLAGLGTHSFGEYNEVQGGVKQKKLEDDQRFFQKFRGGMEYGFGNLIKDISKWLLIGIAIGGLINWGIPDGFAAQYLPRPILAYPAMILIGIPMYVCATGSIPIAAALVAKGISPGAAFVFLAVGPATNTSTITFILGAIGKRATFIYLLAITATAAAFGALLDLFYPAEALKELSHIQVSEEVIWWETLSALVLAALILWNARPTIKKV